MKTRHCEAHERRSGALFAAIALFAGCTTGGTGEPVPAAPAATNVETTVFLIGDAGNPHPGFEPVLAALVADLESTSAPAVVAFLGDNIYPTGMPPRNMPGRAEAERRLGAQIDAVLEGGASGLFVPGNHDWNYSGADGRIRLLAAQEFGMARGDGHVRFVPAGACPGPATIDIGGHARLVVIDTEWWLRKALPPAETLEGCNAITRSDVLDSLRFAIANAGGRNVIVLGHHPLVTNGTHGGHFSLRQHLFPLTDIKSWVWLPLPVIGSAYPIARKLGVSNQDLSGERYEAMRAALEGVFAASPPLVYASGHEHTLQILEGVGARYQIVSGAGIFGHISPVTRSDRTLFYAPGRSGYVRLDIQMDGKVRLGVVQVDEHGGRTETFSTFLE